MKKLILRYVKKDRVAPGDDRYEYVEFNKPRKELVDLHILYEVLSGLLGQVDWAEVDIFSNQFVGFANDCVSLDKLNDRYYISYAFENTPYSQKSSLSVQDFKNVFGDWRNFFDSKVKYIVLQQLDNNNFSIEGKDTLSEDELKYIHE